MVNALENDHLIQELLNAQPDSVVWFKPIFGEGTNEDLVVDFEVRYCNHAAARILGVPPAQVTGTQLRSAKLMDEASIHLIFKQSLEVWETGKPVIFTYYSPGFDKYFQVQRSKVHGGILSITRDRTQEVKTEMEQRLKVEKFQYMIETAVNGVQLLEAVRENGEIIDFMIAYYNQASLELGKLPAQCSGKRITEVMPHFSDIKQLDRLRKVVETGEADQYETTFIDREGNPYGWFIVTLTKFGDGVVSRFLDISQKRKNEYQLEQQKNFITSILDASTSAIAACEAVLNEKGEIADFRYTQINEQYRRLLRKKNVDVIGRTLFELYPSVRQFGTFRKYCSVIETGIPVQFEIYYNADGIDAWFEISCTRVGDYGIVSTFTDITQRKADLLAIEQQKLLLDNILLNSANGISVSRMIRDAEDRVIDCVTILANDAAVNYTGLSREDYLSKRATEIEPNILQSPYFKLCMQTLETGIASYSEYQTESTNRWLSISISKMDRDHLITVFTDITSRKEAQMKMESLVEELKRSNNNLEEFAYAASHDLQEPLRKIQFYSSRLKNQLYDLLSPESLHMFERMQASTGRMRGLIEDLLAYSRVSYRPDQRKGIDLKEVITQVLQDLEPAINESRAIIHIGTLPFIHGDAGQLRQIFQNLISNSLKYRKGDVIPEITISSKRVEDNLPFTQKADQAKTGYYQIDVTDNGIGFDQIYADMIFNVFQRLHGRAEYDGNGIGLSIVKKVVKNHKGHIYASGEAGKGARFSIYFPERAHEP